MVSDDLRRLLLGFAENEVSIVQLEDWLVPNLPVLLSDPASPNADIVSAVELGLAELSRGVRSPDDFRRFVKKVLAEQFSVWTNYPAAHGTWNSSGSSNDTSDSTHWSRSVEFTVQVV